LEDFGILFSRSNALIALAQDVYCIIQQRKLIIRNKNKIPNSEAKIPRVVMKKDEKSMPLENKPK